ncbi:MAG: hypothetical protein MJE12_01650 [Alphaproteobacteria bacterium]|nr:hypothetical protein [Alphaproteobacteria bacterium]
MTLAAVLAVATLHVETARALEPGQCGTPKAVNSHLKAEGHSPVGAMNRSVVNVKTESRQLVAQFVTATQDLSRWYVIRGDAPLGKPSGRFCVSLKGRDLEIKDYRKNRPPTVSAFDFKREEALAQCDEVSKRIRGGVACQFRDHVLAGFERRLGERLVFQGTRVNHSGSESGIFTIVADPQEGDARTLATLDRGATTVIGRSEDFQLSPSVVEKLDAKSQ